MSLSSLLDPRSIALDRDCPDWQSATRAAGDLLVAAGATTDAYTDAMIDAINELGPYVVIAPGLALVHARPSDAVSRTAVSWLRPASPVAFGHATNDPVTLVVGLAALDHDQHRDALMQLAMVFADADLRSRLEALPDADALIDFLETSVPPAPPQPPASPQKESP